MTQSGHAYVPHTNKGKDKTLPPTQALHLLLPVHSSPAWEKILLFLVCKATQHQQGHSLSETHRVRHLPYFYIICAIPSLYLQSGTIACCLYTSVSTTQPVDTQARRQTSSLSLSLTHLSHPQEELQVLKGNPPSSQSLLNGIINFLMSMNITQRQSDGYGGMLPANIHAIRIFGFTHPQPLLSAVLTAAKLSSLR